MHELACVNITTRKNEVKVIIPQIPEPACGASITDDHNYF